MSNQLVVLDLPYSFQKLSQFHQIMHKFALFDIQVEFIQHTARVLGIVRAVFLPEGIRGKRRAGDARECVEIGVGSRIGQRVHPEAGHQDFSDAFWLQLNLELTAFELGRPLCPFLVHIRNTLDAGSDYGCDIRRKIERRHESQKPRGCHESSQHRFLCKTAYS